MPVSGSDHSVSVSVRLDLQLSSTVIPPDNLIAAHRTYHASTPLIPLVNYVGAGLCSVQLLSTVKKAGRAPSYCH